MLNLTPTTKLVYAVIGSLLWLFHVDPKGAIYPGRDIGLPVPAVGCEIAVSKDIPVLNVSEDVKLEAPIHCRSTHLRSNWICRAAKAARISRRDNVSFVDLIFGRQNGRQPSQFPGEEASLNVKGINEGRDMPIIL